MKNEIIKPYQRIYKNRGIDYKMKKGLLSILPVLMLGFASAEFSLSDFLGNIDSSLVLLSAIFILSYILFNFSLSKVFKTDKKFSAIISAILSFLIVYGINSIGWDVEGFFFNLGVSQDIFLTIIPLILLAGMVLLIIKLPKGKKRYFFYIVGGFLVAVGLLIFREAAQILVMGIILVVLGFIIVPIINFIKLSLKGGKDKQKKEGNVNVVYGSSSS
jgi:hypothetical protein